MTKFRSAVELSQAIVESEADQLLAEGNIPGAAHALGEFDSSKLADGTRRVFSHIDLKAMALPLYDIAFHEPTPERLDAANDTYGLLSDLIEQELAHLNEARTYKERGDYLGRLGELTIFSLLLREGIEHGVAAVPIPASRADDKYRHIDFLLTPVGTGRIDDGWPFQVKLARRKNVLQHEAASDVPVIALEDLDPDYFNQPEHRRALPQRILRELAGTASNRDLKNLSFATSSLYEHLLGTKRVRNAERRNLELGKIVSRFFHVQLPELDLDLQPAQA